MTLRSAQSPDRQAGVDAFRYLFCFPVTLLHALPGQGEQPTQLWAALAALACRVAVPFFFIASGYFLRIPERWSVGVVIRPLRRLLPLYIAWYLIYVAIDTIVAGGPPPFNLRGLVTGGSAFHLWFLPVLGITLAALPTLILLIGRPATAVVTMILALLSLALGAYHQPLHLPLFGGKRLLVAPAFVMIGIVLARSPYRPRPGTALAAILVALLLTVAEEIGIATISRSPFTSHDFLVMTFPLGTACFLFARSLRPTATIVRLATLGRLTLGVYASHLIFVRLLPAPNGPLDLAHAIALAIAATLLATVLSVLLDKVPFARRLVR